MKILTILLLFLVIPVMSYSQDMAISAAEDMQYSVVKTSNYYQNTNESEFSKFGFSINPLGFLQFGPVINAEIGISQNIRLNAHVRFPSAGILSYVVNSHSDGLDELEGIAVGGGMDYFFGEKRNQPYAGVFLEYHQTKSGYAIGESYEWWQKDKDVVLIFNGGYRFRFGDVFFINTGAFFGVAYGTYKWFYSDDSGGGSGGNYTPFGMAEVTVGVEL